MEFTHTRTDSNVPRRGGSDALLDRIVDTMAREPRAWTGEEIGRTFLKLTSSGTSGELLVRALLARDPRFTEAPRGSWTARRQAERALLAERVWLAWSPPAEAGRGWRLHLRPWPGSRRAEERVLKAENPEEWRALCDGEADPRFLSLQPGAASRAAISLERSGRFGEPQVVDLSAWVKLVLLAEGVALDALAVQSRLPDVFRRWGLGPLREGSEGALEALASLVDALNERCPGWTLQELDHRRRTSIDTRQVDWTRFAFTRQEVDALPATSGVYRFHDADGVLLYVGKARSLAQRVSSYFRPLPPESTKREELLQQIRSLEIDVLPSELDALIEEATQIRERQPRWNVQIDVHETAPERPSSEWPLLFVAPGLDPLRATVLLLSAPDRGYRLRVPREAGADVVATLGDWLDPILEGADAPEGAGETPGVPCVPLDREGLSLALRYFARFRDEIDRCDALDLQDGRSAAERIFQLCRSMAGGGATLQR